MTTTTNHEKDQKTTAEAQLAKSNEQKAAVAAAQVEREKWMPTPTQAENDAQAVGSPVDKKPDGSPVELTAEQQAEEQKKQTTRHMEAKKPEGGGYQTRSTPARAE
jgi:nitrogen fixation/metabolism regulation signal transduction histidine kinase